MDFKITAQMRAIWAQTLAKLRGADRRLFMASVVAGQSRGAAHQLHKELGWDRGTILKGLKELESGIFCHDATNQRGRKSFEAKVPQLEIDLRKMGEEHSLTDPTFRTTQLYRKLTAGDARRRLIDELGYAAEDVPSERTLRRKLSALGFKPKRVAKSKPLRKIKETDAIFEAVHRINKDADSDEGVVRISIDTKTTVPIGNLSRGGKSRRAHEALDHDLEPEAKVIPFGVHRPATAETWLCFSTGSVTADFMADRLQEIWPALKKTVILRIPW
jgi:Rhodopirellula transposase DDE domain